MTDLNSAKQQADDDLTWLARKVHVCPPTSDYLIRVGNGGYTFREHCEGETVGANWFTRGQWITRRAELQNKPSWSEVESDAEWMAQHPNGRWAFFKHKPVSCSDSGCWRFNWAYSWRAQNVGEVLGDWRDTLERRPQAAKPDPSSYDWHKRGELPPAGMPVQLWFGGSYVYDCEFIAERGNNLILWNLTCDRPDSADKLMCLFRPLQSERERVASELVDVMMAVPVSDRKTASESYMSMALAIYDHLHPENRA